MHVRGEVVVETHAVRALTRIDIEPRPLRFNGPAVPLYVVAVPPTVSTHHGLNWVFVDIDYPILVNTIRCHERGVFFELGTARETPSTVVAPPPATNRRRWRLRHCTQLVWWKSVVDVVDVHFVLSRQLRQPARQHFRSASSVAVDDVYARPRFRRKGFLISPPATRLQQPDGIVDNASSIFLQYHCRSR